MQEVKDTRNDDRMTAITKHTTAVGEKTTKDVNSHTTAESDRVIQAVTSLVQANTQSNPDKIQMAAKLALSSTTVSVLNSILIDEGLWIKGIKEEKAALLADAVPVHRLLALKAEKAGVVKPKSKAKAETSTKAIPARRKRKRSEVPPPGRSSDSDSDGE